MEREMGAKAPTEHQGSAYAVFGMGSCYALGTFTDNFYKQCVVLLAASMQMTAMQSYATVLFSLPFILFSAWAGWLADRLAKKYIVVAAKCIELGALLIGGVMLVQGQWYGILAVLFFMGLQATFFSPALNGSIPETFPLPRVPRVNSLIKLASTAAVLGGIAIAGVFMDFRFGTPPLEDGIPAKGVYFAIDPESLLPFGITTPQEFGRAAASVFIIFIAFLGVLVALTLKKHPSSIERGVAPNPFPFAGPLDSVRHFFACRGDKPLFLVLLAESFFYGIAAIAVISVSNLSSMLAYSDTTTSMLSASLMIGIAVGAIVSGKQPAESWKRLLAPSTFGMGVCLCLTALSPLIPFGDVPGAAAFGNFQLGWMGITLFLCGICGGVYLIPLASYIQVRPSVSEKGKVLGVSNFASFASIALFGVAFYFISLFLDIIGDALAGILPHDPGLFAPAATFAVYGISTICFARFVVIRKIREFGDLA